MRIVEGKKQREVAPEAFAELAQGYARVALDIGTGDGRFVLRQARAEPQTLWIGLDAVGEAMADSARRARAKPAKGGAPNALFAVARAEALPPELAGLCDAIGVNYPWGSLLKAVAEPDPAVMAGIAGCARPGARIAILINLAPFADPDQRARLGLSPLDAGLAETRLRPAYAEAGIAIDAIETVHDLPAATAWGGRLVKGSGRETLSIKGVFSKSGA
jgi:16S rRNA (adenine(1408)-N(1))-methyltransferase